MIVSSEIRTGAHPSISCKDDTGAKYPSYLGDFIERNLHLLISLIS